MGEGSKRRAGGQAVRRLGVISGPREEDWGAGLECVKVTGSERGEREGGWRAGSEEARGDFGAKRGILGAGA